VSARPPALVEERRLWAAGHLVVAGMDEVGRGAWAGPVTVGVAVLGHRVGARSVPRRLRDSKVLSEAVREMVFDEVTAWCVDWAVGHAEHSECDALGMTAALDLAGRRALAQLRVRVDALVVDGPRSLLVEELRSPEGGRTWTGTGTGASAGWEPTVTVPVVGGDARCVSVAAASVVAKVTRDRRMRAEAAHFPPFDLERNKGYPSAAHRRALLGYGLTSIHRRSWVYVESLPWGRGGDDG